jgi:hypothetical protein
MLTQSRSIRAPTSASSSIPSTRGRAVPSLPGTRSIRSSASYTWALPIEAAFTQVQSSDYGWSLSGTTRFASGFPVTLYDNSDNSLLGTLGNGVNNYLLDTPQYLPGRSRSIPMAATAGRPSILRLFPEENLGQLGNARRRIFYGPGIENFDMTLKKNLRLDESRSLEFRAEAFNAFNHAQFYGPHRWTGKSKIPTSAISSAPPRLAWCSSSQNSEEAQRVIRSGLRGSAEQSLCSRGLLRETSRL